MQNTEFSITLTSPFVDTASGLIDGEPFSGDSFRHSLTSRKIALDKHMITVSQNEKIKELRGDLLAVKFHFVVPAFLAEPLCKDIVNEIVQHKAFSPKRRILVEGENGSSVIPLGKDGSPVVPLSSSELAAKIQEIVMPT